MPPETQNVTKLIFDYGLVYVLAAIGVIAFSTWLFFYLKRQRWMQRETDVRDLKRQDKDIELRDTLIDTQIKNSRSQERTADAIEEVARCTTEMKATNSAICSSLAAQARLLEYGHEIVEILTHGHTREAELRPKLDKIKASLDAGRNRLT